MQALLLFDERSKQPLSTVGPTVNDPSPQIQEMDSSVQGKTVVKTASFAVPAAAAAEHLGPSSSLVEQQRSKQNYTGDYSGLAECSAHCPPPGDLPAAEV